MFSSYLNKDIALTTKTATLEGGKQQTIVLHAELEQIILTMDKTVKFDYPVVIPSMTDAVVTCKIWDDAGHYVVALGEATKNTCNSTIADNYPTTTAANRAFDRAAIRFLGLGRVYSDLEIAPDGPKRYDSSKLTDGPAPIVSGDEEETNVDESLKPENVVDANVPKEQKIAPPSDADDGSTVVITIGKYAGKNKTIEEIYKEDVKWLQYIANNLTPKKDEFKVQVEFIKKYLATHEVA